MNAPRWSWQGRRRRSSEQWRATIGALEPYERPELPVIVEITRTGWARLDEHDNLRSALKTVVDAIAHWLQCDDRDSRVTWRYGQQVTRATETVQTRRGPVSQSVNRITIRIATRE